MKAMPLRKEPPLVVILGLPFHDVTLEETLDFCRESMSESEGRYLVTANVDFTTQAYDDPDLRKIVFFADRVVCDGMPLVWLSRCFGYRLRERVAGSDIVPRLLEICGELRYPVYFFGSDIHTLQEAKVIAEKSYPGLVVAGIDSPPMGAVVEWENDDICEKMRLSGAKLLLVCLGCPKQERWIFANYRESGIPLSIGVGASLDFITGKQKRAPRWMQKTGFEWFWRMSGDPRRLASRYAHDFHFLVKASYLQALAQRRRDRIGDDVRTVIRSEVSNEPEVIRLTWKGSLEISTLDRAVVPERVTADVFLDTSDVTFVDSSGLGRLALLTRLCRNAGKTLFLLHPSYQVREAVQSVKMSSLFPIVESEEQAFMILALQKKQDVSVELSTAESVTVSFNHSLDALHHEEMMRILEQAIETNAAAKHLVINLRGVDFIDSRAVGGLIRARKIMLARSGDLFLTGAKPAVKEIITLLRLDKVLSEWKGEIPS